MGLLDFFRSLKRKKPPTPFETLAAFSKFQNVSECNPEFYTRHKNAIDMTVGFLAFVSSQHENLAKVFAHNSSPMRNIAKGLESAMTSAELEQHALDFIDTTRTTITESLLPAVKDPELPEYLKECVWPIEGGV